MCGNKAGDLPQLWDRSKEKSDGRNYDIISKILEHPEHYPTNLNSDVAQSTMDLLSMLTLFILAIWPMYPTKFQFDRVSNEDAMPSAASWDWSGYDKPPPGDEEEFADNLFGFDLNWIQDPSSAKGFVMSVANALGYKDCLPAYASRFEQRTMGSFIEFLATLQNQLRTDIDTVTLVQQRILAIVQTVAIAVLNLIVASHVLSKLVPLPRGARTRRARDPVRTCAK